MLILRQGVPHDVNPTETLRKYKNPPLLHDENDGYETVFSLGYDQDKQNRQYLLSCTGSIFGCFTDNGSSTFNYWQSVDLPYYENQL
jgi:hypothetical protein